MRAFLEETLGPEGLRKSVVVVATSDRPAPVRVRATFLAATIADYFRDQGQDVLLIMDSVTRFAMAQREIGLAVGEPPSQKGYTPSVFQLLPRIFERAGKFASGSTTGFYTVLVEGDDMNDPIADSCRALLDGHIVLSRELASGNHYPAVDVLESVSRLARAVSTPEHAESAARLRDAWPPTAAPKTSSSSAPTPPDRIPRSTRCCSRATTSSSFCARTPRRPSPWPARCSSCRCSPGKL